MDLTANIELNEQSERRSDGTVATVGEKRSAENGEDSELNVRLKKKGRGEAGDMKRVAEIVLVLSAMAGMRGGRSPTAAEVAMMAEARAKVAEMCLGLAPADIVAKEAIGDVIEDLGLNSKAREQKLGFRPPPKMPIAEKLLHTKRRMEESKEFAYSSQRLQTSFGPAAESRGTSNNVRVFPSDKSSHPPVSSGGFPTTSPLGHVSAATSTSLPHQLPTNEVRSSMVSSGLPSSQSGRDSSSLALPRVERVHFRLDGGTRPVQANSSADHSHVNAPTWTIQPQSATSAKSGPENKLPNQTSAKVDGTVSRMAPQATRDQTSRPFITQTASANLPSIHQPLQGMNFIQAPSLSNKHNEIAKIVQKLLQPQLPEHPTWTPPSRDYMNKALTCQMCKLTINEVESVLLCDACEKGYHIKCLQSYNQKGIPRGEWHCPKCLALSHGKPLPPKYGRVMRNMNAPKVPPNSTGVHSSSEKKAGSVDHKVNQQKITANGISGLQSPAHTGTMGENCIELASGSKMPNAGEMQGNNVSSSRKNVDDKPSSGSFPDNSMKSLKATSGSPSVGSASSERLVSELKSQPTTKLSDAVSNISDLAQALDNSHGVDQAGLLNCADVLSKKYHDNNPKVKDSEKSTIRENIDCTSFGARERAGFSADGLRSVDWIGDVLKVVDEKTFYQSCCIDGVEYKVHNHALFRSSNDKLIPSKLQAMWEDSKTRSKWVIVNRCYFPGDLPEVVGRPCAPENNEVYESNHDSTVMAGLIQGPCEVLPLDKFKEESERRTSLGTEANDGLQPIFLCKWFYDEFKGLFQPVSS
ncbi:hypothetical protein L1049_001389 [Liquidambar formosana]|uniref:PHD finger protein n=1 Tax=Liquidambar formosana TaxID=63359 RepID=A0AAP0NAI0_LIQFO